MSLMGSILKLRQKLAPVPPTGLSKVALLMDELILIKHYTVVVYYLGMCIKKHNLGSNLFKGDE